ncbi:hypothetical protein Lal_00033699 [Lupinus albus]|nr:hypothetical protein Lal_00033699 [Lupinus albus]
MTRRNSGILHSINPEIDRTYHRLVRQNRTLDANFFYVSEHPVAENTASEHSVSVHSEYSDYVHSIAFTNFDHSVHSENIAQQPTPPGPCERTLRELAAPDFTYDSLCIQYEDVPYVLKTRLIHLLPKFNGLAEPRTGDHPEAYAANIYNNRPPYQQQHYDPPSSSTYNRGWRNQAPFQNNNAGQNRPSYVPPPIQQ